MEIISDSADTARRALHVIRSTNRHLQAHVYTAQRLKRRLMMLALAEVSYVPSSAANDGHLVSTDFALRDVSDS